MGSSSQDYLDGLEGSSSSFFWEWPLRSWGSGCQLSRQSKGRALWAEETAWAKA